MGKGKWVEWGLLAVIAWAAAPLAAETHRSNGFAFEVASPPPWVIERAVPETWDSQYPGARGGGWRNWSLDNQVDRRGGRRQRYSDHAYEAGTRALVGQAARFKIHFIPEFQTLAIHRVEVRRDGRWSNRLTPGKITLAQREAEFESDLATGVVTALIVLEDVQPRDVVRVSYTLTGANPVLSGLDHEEQVFGWVDPILERGFRVLFDRSADPLVRKDEGVPDARIRALPDAIEVLFLARGVEAIRNEGDYPTWYSPFPKVQLTERRSWTQIADWAATLYPPPQPLPESLQALIGEWSRIDSEGERVAAALRAVQDEIRYFGIELGENSHRPSEPGDTWNRRFGDCKDKARLLVTILHELGVAAVPALVSAQHGADVRLAPPSAAAFDHVIVQAQVEGKTLWLDPTRMLQRGRVDEMAVGNLGYALPVMVSGQGLQPIERPAGAGYRKVVTERLEALPSGDAVRLDVLSVFEGEAAVEIRRQFALQRDDEILRNYADYYSRRFGVVKPSGPIEYEDDAEADRVTVRERYLLDQPWDVSVANVRGIDAHAGSIAPYVTPPSSPTRRAPLALAHPIDVKHRYELVLPEGWRWPGESMDTSVEGPGLAYHRSISVTDGVLVKEDGYRSLAEHVPDDQLAEHLQARRQVQAASSINLLIEPGAPRTREQRELRLRNLLDDLMDKPAKAGARKRR